jgi:AcrR family transcriptional regulator
MDKSAITIKKSKTSGKRLSPEEREAHIVKGAIEFFSEVGFEGKTRDLANRLGITQPLLYRYFPTKDVLIERVYQEVFVQRFEPKWTELITNRSIPIRDRLVEFYSEYDSIIYNYQWVRIFMFAGLKGVDINKRYVELMEETIIKPICIELRDSFDLENLSKKNISDLELEFIWGFHGTFFYRAIRKWIYHRPIPSDVSLILHQDIDNLLKTVKESFLALNP